MVKEYTKEEIGKILEKLPEELKDALFSEDTTDEIYNACERNEVPEKEISKISKFVGWVFLGLLNPDEFENTLKSELGFDSKKAKRVASEIYRFVFHPVQNQLDILYKTRIKTSETKSEEMAETKPLPKEAKEILEERKNVGEDKYREPIE